MNILFFDFETTGFSERWNEVIEVAGILYDMENAEILDTFHEYIKPQAKIPREVVELTGITNEAVENCRSEKEVLDDFVVFIMGNQVDALCGHNCKAFDLRFLRAKSEKYGLPYEEMMEYKDVIDTLSLARRYKREGKIPKDIPSLCQTQLAELYGVDYQAHSALEDVKALIEIYKKMTGKKKNTREELGF